MIFKRIIIFVLACILGMQNASYAVDQELLKSTDVGRIMHEIFKQHVEKREMSDQILKNAFKVYIDQFDPYRIYLLEEEVSPWVNLNDDQMELIMQQYRYNDYSAFYKLNEVIQQAIVRARNLRVDIEKNKESLFNPSQSNLPSEQEDWLDPNLKLAFAKNIDELKTRIQKHFIHFINEEKKRYGTSQILKNQDQTLAIYNIYLNNQEDAYLYVTEQGNALDPAKKENLQVLHILKALANSLDAHTTFYNNVEAYDMRVRLEKAFEGIGVALQQEPDGSVLITKVFDGGPAAKSGQVKANDIIVSIDGNMIKDMPLDKVMEMIRGENGSSLTLNILRKAAEGSNSKDQELAVTLKREPITVNDDRVDISYEKFGNGIIGKLTLHAFYQGENGVTSENDLRKAIKELKQKGNLRGLILDMRENSGGFLTQAVKVAGLFITNGVVVISKYNNGKEHYYRDMDGSLAYDGPLVILTSKATASAAEIVAQALQDYGVGVVVGDDRTYGKGTIQSQTVTDDKAASFFKVTVGKYYTVSGKTPQLVGVKSDILVPGIYSQEHLGEKYLPNALSNDQIKSEYNDDLADVSPDLKSWYLRYYLPTIQRKKDYWDSLIPILKRNSEYRLSQNKNYQSFLKKIKGLPEDKEDQTLAKAGDHGKDDLQMNEAVNIVKDMIMLQSHAQATNLAAQQANITSVTSDSQNTENH